MTDAVRALIDAVAADYPERSAELTAFGASWVADLDKIPGCTNGPMPRCWAMLRDGSVHADPYNVALMMQLQAEGTEAFERLRIVQQTDTRRGWVSTVFLAFNLGHIDWTRQFGLAPDDEIVENVRVFETALFRDDQRVRPVRIWRYATLRAARAGHDMIVSFAEAGGDAVTLAALRLPAGDGDDE